MLIHFIPGCVDIVNYNHAETQYRPFVGVQGLLSEIVYLAVAHFQAMSHKHCFAASFIRNMRKNSPRDYGIHIFLNLRMWFV